MRKSKQICIWTALACMLLFASVPALSFADEFDADVSAGAATDDQLTITAPEQITLGFLPKKLEVSCTPSTIYTGMDCNMDDMCGLDPCLCGIPDEYGACACNGTQPTQPTVSVVPGDDALLVAVHLGMDIWLVPLAVGSTQMLVSGVLPHFGGDEFLTTVTVDAPLPPIALYLLLLLIVLAALVLLGRSIVRFVAKKRGGRKSAYHSGESHNSASAKHLPPNLGVMLTLVLSVAALGLSACGASAKVTDQSPQLASSSVVSTGDGSESGQTVEVRLVFDKNLVAQGDITGDLEITLNGAAIDDKAVAVTAAVEGADTLLLTLTPAAGTAGTSSPHYFAVYEGALTVGAKDASGGLAHLTGTGGGANANAVIASTIAFQIPSGLAIELAEKTVGNAATNTPTKASFRIVDLPVIRAVAWFELEPDGERYIVHNHEFNTYKNDTTSRERYATHVADSLRRLADDDYIFTAKGDTVTVIARSVVDGQVIEPEIYLGDA